jgi:hypothetical protein
MGNESRSPSSARPLIEDEHLGFVDTGALHEPL